MKSGTKPLHYHWYRCSRTEAYFDFRYHISLRIVFGGLLSIVTAFSLDTQKNYGVSFIFDDKSGHVIFILHLAP